MTKVNPQPSVQYLEWDSNFFGKRIARINDSLLTPELIYKINSWSKENQIDCLYFLASTNDDRTIRLAEKDGFHFVDIRVTLGIHVSSLDSSFKPNLPIREPTENDIPVLRSIARVNHSDSRFFMDHNFEKKKCHELYEIWIEKDCRKETGVDIVFVWEERKKAVAYITLKNSNDQTGRIELFGVAPEWRGKGIGRKLVERAIGYFKENQINTVSVITQGRNIPAQILYQKCGFVTQSVELWYHKWFETLN